LDAGFQNDNGGMDEVELATTWSWEVKGNDQAIFRKKNSGSNLKEWPFSHPLFIQNNNNYDKIQ